MILFNKSLEEDYGYLLTAVKEGKVSEERLTKLYFDSCNKSFLTFT